MSCTGKLCEALEHVGELGGFSLWGWSSLRFRPLCSTRARDVTVVHTVPGVLVMVDTWHGRNLG